MVITKMAAANQPDSDDAGIAQAEEAPGLLDSVLSTLRKRDPKEEAKERDYKAKRQRYEQEKNKHKTLYVAGAKDIMVGTLKMRGTLKLWQKYWCVLRPGLLLYYKDTKRDDWQGTILLSGGEVVERPSRHDGFCFKFFNNMKHNIHADRGPNGEMFFNLNLPADHVIMRCAADQGAAWMTAFTQALKSAPIPRDPRSSLDVGALEHEALSDAEIDESMAAEHELQSPSQHGAGAASPPVHSAGLRSPTEPSTPALPALLSQLQPPSTSELALKRISAEHQTAVLRELSKRPRQELAALLKVTEPAWVADTAEYGIVQLRDEPVPAPEGESNSILWSMIKQIRPGMDLSKLSFPVFVLEPRSFLDKFADSFRHVQFFNEAARCQDPHDRMLHVLRWFFSTYYKRPRGLKKPYNPLLGEVFRCMYTIPAGAGLPETQCFVVVEQVSHHPPITAIVVSNRRAGWVLHGQVRVGSKFLGNGIDAPFDAKLTLTLLEHREDYVMTLPDYHVKGLVLGSTTTEFGGPCSVHCKKTGYMADLKFLMKPLIGGTYHAVEGKLGLHENHSPTASRVEVLRGRWDDTIYIGDQMLFRVDEELVRSRVPRFILPKSAQWPYVETPEGHYDSEITWEPCTKGILENDSAAASTHKNYLEECQRKKTKIRKDEDFKHRFFEKTGDRKWRYRHINLDPWSADDDLLEFMADGVIQTATIDDLPDDYLANATVPAAGSDAESPLRTDRSLPAPGAAAAASSHLSLSSRDASMRGPLPAAAAAAAVATGGAAARKALASSASFASSVSVDAGELTQRVGALEQRVAALVGRLEAAELRRHDSSLTPLLGLLVLLMAIQLYAQLFN
eukprot:m.205957 g.205957  ORF g.205957 m.205957 type:complete len:850 (-) comp15533_c1_seq1:66-2615(-)